MSLNPTIIFHDMSGSTANVTGYFDLAIKITRGLIGEGINVYAVGWNTDTIVFPTVDTYLSFCYDKVGSDGTLTSSIGKFLKNPSLKIPIGSDVDLIIFTDGAVDIADIQKCDNEMKECKYVIKNMKAYIYNYNDVNCSVLAPFMRGDWTCSVFRHYNNSETKIYSMSQTDRSRLFETIKTATTQVEVDEVFDKLSGMIASITMGKTQGDPELRNDILKLADRIKQNIKSSFSSNSEFEAFENELSTNGVCSVDTMLKLSQKYQTSINGTDFQSKINSLLKICDGTLSNLFNISDIRAQSLDRSSAAVKQASPEELEKIMTETMPNVSIANCPITLDTSPNIVVFIRTGDPVFTTADKKVQDMIITNGFMTHILSDKIKERMDGYISLEAYLQLPDNTISPLSNAKSVACMVLGADPESVKATDYAIAQLTRGNDTVVGNRDLWFHTIYKMVENGDMPWLTDVLPMFRNQMIYRLKNSFTTISMSGLVNHTQARTTLANALYYTICQPAFNKDVKTSSFPIFAGSNVYIQNLINLVGYKLPTDNLIYYYTVIRTLSRLVSECKSMHIEQFRVKYDCSVYRSVPIIDLTPEFEEFVKNTGQYFERILVDSTDQDATEISNLDYNLSLLVTSENLKTFDIDINFDDIMTYYNPIFPNYPTWKLYTQPLGTHKLSICPATMRPWTYVNNKHWKDQFIETFTGNVKAFSDTEERRPMGEVFSGVKYYGNFVEKFKFFPTRDDFLLFCFNAVRKCENSHYTIPCDYFCDVVVDTYNSIIGDTTPAQFINILASSMNRSKRIELEHVE
jgi:hypothetical protein